MNTKFRFNQTSVMALPSGPKQYEVRDSVCPGLVLRINTTGTKTYMFWQKKNGKNVKVRIGRVLDVSVEQARISANAIRVGLTNQIIAKQLSTPEIPIRTFGEIYSRYYSEHAVPHTKRPLDNQRVITIHILPHIGSMRLHDISRERMKAIHYAMGETTGKGQANRLLDMASAVFNFALREDLFEGKNPCEGIKRFKRRKRDRFLSKVELVSFFSALGYEEQIYQDFFSLLLFIGSRKGNMLTMKWSDVYFELKQWRIPGEKSKNDETNIFVIPDVAIEILERRRAKNLAADYPSEYVFPGTGKQGHLVQPKKSISRIRNRMEVYDFTIHDLRRTMASHMAISKVSLPIIGKALNHKSQQSTEIYARLSQDPVTEAVNDVATAISSYRPQTKCQPHAHFMPDSWNELFVGAKSDGGACLLAMPKWLQTC